MRETRWRYSLLLALMALATLLSGGCLSVLSQSGPDSVPAAAPGSGLRAALVDQEADWGFSRGCTWTAELQVANPGNTSEKNVHLQVELVNARTGAVRDAKDLFIGAIGPGEERTVRVVLDGECLDEYTVRAIPVVSGP
ncbi:MAG TPA: hypothetical protein HA264_07380 [Methanolinea sp.]|nr:MAG: hypothetical protein A4E41_01077 [Methanoregulaceae archaeon PtaU1.Bin066]HII76838.1 hypothetical protein [Methanolinea sp.]HNQ29144.1 hypothetical protein [Methanolinea sp.]HNS82844.1 hypothetical protein [Methanolinea sp.]